MELSVEVTDFTAHFDYECSRCRRKIRFTTAFFMQNFKFPLKLQCKKCGKEFTIDLKIHGGDVTKFRPNRESRRSASRKMGGDSKSDKSS